jgi:3-oxoacyl-[acyl-carrier protein] reductase
MAFVNEFAQNGWKIAAASRSRLAFESPNVVPLPFDLLLASGIVSAAERAKHEFIHFNVLINNAGIIDDELLGRMSEEQFTRVVETNLGSVFKLCRAFRPLLHSSGGHIINIGSFVGRHGSIGQANYAAAKAGLIGLGLSLARELGPENVRVNTIFPGPLRTRMTAHFDEARWKAFAAQNALGRTNDPAEIARFVYFLTQTENISGQVFNLDSRIGAWA